MQYPIQTCCYATGHRDMPRGRKSIIQARVRETVMGLVREGVIHFVAGGAEGFDTWFACAVLETRRILPQITLTLMLPEKEYRSRGGQEDEAMRRMVRLLADEVLVIPNRGRENALDRDDAMIDAGAICVAYLRDNVITGRGGTSYTVRHSVNRGRKIINLWLQEDGFHEGGQWDEAERIGGNVSGDDFASE